MSTATPPVEAMGPVPRRRLSPVACVGLGLLLTLAGLFVLGGIVPTAPGTLERAIAVTGIGALALWLGGMFLGLGRRR